MQCQQPNELSCLCFVPPSYSTCVSSQTQQLQTYQSAVQFVLSLACITKLRYIIAMHNVM